MSPSLYLEDDMARSERFDAGARILEKLFGRAPAEAPRDDFGRITVEHLFGEVWNRPGLELRERSMVTVAALVALGREAELKLHVRGALNLGIPEESIREIILHLAHYAGWPAAVGSLRAAQEAFDAKAKS